MEECLGKKCRIHTGVGAIPTEFKGALARTGNITNTLQAWPRFLASGMSQVISPVFRR